jgi:thymidylate synthase
MKSFHASSADGLWRQVHAAIANSDAPRMQGSRIGDTYELTQVGLEIDEPLQRWVVSRVPAINPAFAIAEVVWILAGKNSSAVLNYWNRELPKYAGSGSEYHGAYGHRLRQHFGFDQLHRAYQVLRSNSDSRQVVLQLWDAQADLPSSDGKPRDKDIPCNIASMLKVRSGRLEWTQIMRSNDLFLGLPYNLLQFTTLQEVVAGWLGVEVGSYHHWSDSLHIYVSDSLTMSRDDIVTLEPNTDSLALDFESWQEVIAQMYERLAALTASDLQTAQVARLATNFTGPSAYRNLLLILGAESARRRGAPSLSRELSAECNNPQLRQAWEAWMQRCLRNRLVSRSESNR